MDREGAVVKKPQFKAIMAFSEGLAAFKSSDDGRWGYLNTKGDIVIEPIFDAAPGAASPFREGRAVVLVNGDRGVIDRTGAWIVKPTYRRITSFSEGRAVAMPDSNF